MKSLLRLLSLCLFGLLALASFQPVDACSPVMGRGAHVAIANESAIIVWNEKTKTEHFIRRATFSTKIDNFGFLVPTPTRPKVTEAPQELFGAMEDWTRPEVRTQTVRRKRGWKNTRSMMAGAAMPAGKVDVLESSRVGSLDYSILQADDSKALKKWLLEHEYVTRPELDKWLDRYVKQGWIIAAFRYVRTAHAQAVATEAVVMSFKSEKPFYPYCEPADMRTPGMSSGRGRLLRVFLVGPQRMQGELEDKTHWPGRTEWANKLTTEQLSLLQDRLKKSAAVVPENPWLTVFDDSSSPRMGTADLVFAPSAEQTTVRRPPIVQIVEVDEPPMPMSWLSGAVVLGASFLLVALVFAAWRFTLRGAPRPE